MTLTKLSFVTDTDHLTTADHNQLKHRVVELQVDQTTYVCHSNVQGTCNFDYILAHTLTLL